MRTDCFDDEFFASLTHFLGRECASRLNASVLIIKGIAHVLKSLSEMGKAFRKSILRAKNSIKNAMRESPDSLPRISGGDAKTINDAVMEIRHLTSQANDLVNEIDVDGVAIPSALMDYISKYDDLLPTPTKDGTCVFRLDVLNRIAEIRANEKLAPEYSFVVRYRSAILELHKELETLKSGINEFNEWVHDMGHYLVQLDRKLPCVTDVGVQMLEDDLRVIDALFSGIRLLEQERTGYCQRGYDWR